MLDFGVRKWIMRKKKIVSRLTSTTSHKLIALKLDEVKALVIKNSKDIEDLKAWKNYQEGFEDGFKDGFKAKP